MKCVSDKELEGSVEVGILKEIRASSSVERQCQLKCWQKWNAMKADKVLVKEYEMKAVELSFEQKWRSRKLCHQHIDGFSYCVTIRKYHSHRCKNNEYESL